MDELPRTDWDAVRRDWDSPGITLYSMARKHGTTVADICVRAGTNKWPTRSDDQDWLILVSRLLGVLELQIEHLERKEMTKDGEKEAAVLGKLTVNLDKLIDLKKSRINDPEDETETAEMRDIRERLAARINALTKG